MSVDRVRFASAACREGQRASVAMTFQSGIEWQKCSFPLPFLQLSLPHLHPPPSKLTLFGGKVKEILLKRGMETVCLETGILERIRKLSVQRLFSCKEWILEPERPDLQLHLY